MLPQWWALFKCSRNKINQPREINHHFGWSLGYFQLAKHLYYLDDHLTAHFTSYKDTFRNWQRKLQHKCRTMLKMWKEILCHGKYIAIYKHLYRKKSIVIQGTRKTVLIELFLFRNSNKRLNEVYFIGYKNKSLRVQNINVSYTQWVSLIQFEQFFIHFLPEWRFFLNSISHAKFGKTWLN